MGRTRPATTAAGGAYKVCWPEGCLGSDILAGIDAAVADGVGVLSLSLGGSAAPYFRDTVAVGSFGAMAAGVFVACSAGNSGPSGAMVANSAPWVATVGVGTLDRDIPTYVTLPTRVRLAGVSLYAGPAQSARPVMLPLVYGGGRDNTSKLCLSGTLNPASVRSKIVLCDRSVKARVQKGIVVKAAGQQRFMQLMFDLMAMFVFVKDPSCLAADFPRVPFVATMDDAEEVMFFRHVTPIVWRRIQTYLNIGDHKKMNQARHVLDASIPSSSRSSGAGAETGERSRDRTMCAARLGATLATHLVHVANITHLNS
ncbi:hypothetical protein ACQ4PT_000447 [Festuca glaucescens]